MTKQEFEFGICWFQSEQWERLIEISEDREELDDNYEEWRKNASRAFDDIISHGKKVRKMRVNLEDLLAWCNENGVPVNGRSRANYVAYLLEHKREP